MPEDKVLQSQRRTHIYENLQQSIELCKLNYSGKKELATEQDAAVLDLCEALEDAFTYGIRVQGNNTAANFFQNMQEIVTGAANVNEDNLWQFCQLHLTTHEKQRYMQLKQVWNDCGRGRAFIRATLNEHTLRRYFLSWLDDKANLLKYYTHWSLLLHEPMAQAIPVLLESLQQVLFALTVDTVQLNSRTRLHNINAIRPVLREEPIIYAPTPAAAPNTLNGAKRKIKERPITGTSSAEDLMVVLQQSTLPTCSKDLASLGVHGKEEQASLLIYDPIEPELEFLKTPLTDYSDINKSLELAAEEYGSDDTSSQYSKSSSANCCTLNSSSSPSVLVQQLKDTEERLEHMTAHCSTLETRLAELTSENRKLLRRLTQVFESTGINPASTIAGYNLLINIPQVHLLKTKRDTSSYYAYEISITIKQNKEHWSVLRRYRDFYKLHQCLLRTHPFISAIELPPKKHFGNMKAVFVEQRRAQLEIYLSNVLDMLPQVEACKSKAELQRVFPFFRHK